MFLQDSDVGPFKASKCRDFSTSLFLSVTQASSSVRAFELQKCQKANYDLPSSSCWDKETPGLAPMQNGLFLELCLWVVGFVFVFFMIKGCTVVINKM